MEKVIQALMTELKVGLPLDACHSLSGERAGRGHPGVKDLTGEQ